LERNADESVACFGGWQGLNQYPFAAVGVAPKGAPAQMYSQVVIWGIISKKDAFFHW
jgi:hypothetical protein